nr:MAG TPA: hypothetical protein [Caudoviricetes sp.]
MHQCNFKLFILKKDAFASMMNHYTLALPPVFFII